jgi:stearoyl-CoA desaturase (delta-9 desaturase)
MKPIFLFLSSLSGIGGPKTWIRVHALRDHWQNQKTSPRALTYDNSLLHDFFINLHCKIIPKDNAYLKRLSKDILKDKWVVFFEFAWVPLNLLFFISLWVFFDIETAIYLIAFRITISIIGHWLVGYIVHSWGYKTYDIEDASEEGRNSLVLGWFTFEEAYHNNHHKFPESASMGLKKMEFDVSYLSLLILKKLGLASDIKLACEHHSK